MNKVALIRQPAGLGDILFGQKIAHKIMDIGYDVIWPVFPVFSWIGDYIKTGVQFPNVVNDFHCKNIYDIKKLIKTDEFIYLPLDTAGKWFKEDSVMECKYKMAGLKSDDWADYLHITRNIEKENELFYNVLGLKDNEEYIFVNKNYNTHPLMICKYIPEKFESKVIEMGVKDGYSLFDWYKVLENAKEIHTVETSLNYLIEVNKNIKCPLYMYSKWNPVDYHHIQHLFKRDWVYKK